MMNTWINVDKVCIYWVSLLIICKAVIEGVTSPAKGKVTLKSHKSNANKTEQILDDEVTCWT